MSASGWLKSILSVECHGGGRTSCVGGFGRSPRSSEIPDRLVTFQVMRRTLGTDLQKHGSLKDAQGALRHASIKTTGDVYVQTIEESVLNAMNSRTMGDSCWMGTSRFNRWRRKRRRRRKMRILDGNLLEVARQLDQVGPSLEVVSL